MARRFAPVFRALGVREHSRLRYNNYSDKKCRDHTYIIGTTLSKEKSLGTTLSQEYPAVLSCLKNRMLCPV